MAAAEAIGDGIPAIVSGETGIAEIIEHHGGGQIIEPATDQIISAIEEFLEQ
jgi:glycosyltransferase involved in cell wall biosynthesis